MRFRGDSIPASPARVLLAAVAVISWAAPPLPAQAARAAEPYSRGKPLSEWVTQATHYIPELRREAVRAIAALGPGASSALPTLVRATRDENEEVRFWAVTAIGGQGHEARSAAPALITVMADDLRRVQEAARHALEALGPVATPVLLPALRSRDPWLRANAAEAIGVVGDTRGRVVPELIALLVDDSLWVRASGAWALGQIGPAARSAAKPLARMLQEELRRDPALAASSGRVRVEHVTFALGRMGRHAGDAVPQLLSVFRDGSDSLRSVATVALAAIGKKAARPLGEALQDGPMAIRLDAARGLRLMGPEAKDAVAELIRLLERIDELEGGRELVIAAADALGAIGKDAKAARRALERQRARSVSPDVVAALDRALRKLRYGG